jgi:hypothetical protein
VPTELKGAGEGFEVGNGPLVAIGATCADEIAQQMQVEAQENEQSGQPWMSGGPTPLNHRAKSETRQRASYQKRDEGAYNRENQRVQGVVILGKPQQRMG